jgi:dihydrofolate reductase
MGNIVIATNMTLDGVVQDPDGAEGFSRGGWFMGVGDKERRYREWAKVEFNEALAATALLLGRRTDEYFATRWASRTGEFADRLNSMPKYVVSSTLQEPRWSNATVLKGDVTDEVTRLKQKLDGDILVYASYQLERLLIEHDLVDELRVIVHPVVLGAGQRLFGETTRRKPLRLVSNQSIAGDLAYLIYQRIEDV